MDKSSPAGFALIAYREFYDVPRVIVVRCGGSVFLLDSVFDTRLDDYAEDYEVCI